MLEIVDVSLRPGARGFSHAFGAGEITVVLGANQSGKTDLCRLIAGLPSVATGEVLIDGESMSGVGTRRRPVAMVYQAFINYPNLTVAQNIASPLRARGETARLTEARVAELAAKLQIEGLLSRFPHELSGGQQQRVAIARALARQARVLLLDEPLVNLDFKLREALQDELVQLLADSGTVVIYTSTDPRDAFALADQVLLLADGQVQQSGPPMQLYRAPASMTAMQMLSDPGVNRLRLDDAECGIRPEHIRPASSAPESGYRQFSMHITAFETSGDESFVHGVVQDEDWVMRAPGILNARAGDQLAVAVREADITRFESAS